jgi:Piwi domain
MLVTPEGVESEGQEQYLANVALKLNTKLGGINHLLGKEAMTWLTHKSTIMVGIDVTHPSPRSAQGTRQLWASLQVSTVILCSSRGVSAYKRVREKWVTFMQALGS